MASQPEHANDLPPPYSAVAGNPQYGFVPPAGAQPYNMSSPEIYPKTFTAPGVYPHPIPSAPMPQGMPPQVLSIPPPGLSMPLHVTEVPRFGTAIIAPGLGTEPATITCFNCNKIVTTRVNYSTSWHTHLVAGAICVMTMFCSMCCLGLVPYCFDAFKDAEHYCPACNTFIGKCSKC